MQGHAPSLLRGLLLSAIAMLGGCAGAGRRSGFVPLFGAHRTFSDLDLSIGATQSLEGPVQLIVQLSRPERWSHTGDGCFVATDDLRVTVDGQPLERDDAGGKARPTQISGLELQLSRCAPASFRSRAGAHFDARPQSLVVVEDTHRRAEMEVRDLLTRRQLQLEPSSQVRPGERLTLLWTPTEDEWSGHDLSTSVQVYFPDDFSVTLERSALDISLPRFSFVLPDVRPGPARVGLATMYLQAHPRILRCEGVNSCDAVAQNGPAAIELTVLPK